MDADAWPPHGPTISLQSEAQDPTMGRVHQVLTDIPQLVSTGRAKAGRRSGPPRTLKNRPSADRIRCPAPGPRHHAFVPRDASTGG